MLFPKPRPRVLDKRDEKRERDANERRVFAEVDARDQRRCRCCGRQGDPNATTLLGRIHRHHIRYRSKGGFDEPRNLLSLCAVCHALEHAGQLAIIGTDANERIGFEIHEAAVVEVFGRKVLPPHVHIVAESRHVVL
jgi:hypothetical protein